MTSPISSIPSSPTSQLEDDCVSLPENGENYNYPMEMEFDPNDDFFPMDDFPYGNIPLGVELRSPSNTSPYSEDQRIEEFLPQHIGPTRLALGISSSDLEMLAEGRERIVETDTESSTSSPKEKDLLFFVREGNLTQVRELCTDATREQKVEAFIQALILRQQSIWQPLIDYFLNKENIDPNELDSEGNSPMHVALSLNSEAFLYMLERQEIVQDEHLLAHALYARNGELVNAVLNKMPVITAAQELLSKEIIKEETPMSLVSDVNLTLSLMFAFPTVPYELIKDILDNELNHPDESERPSFQNFLDIYIVGMVREDSKLLEVISEVFEENGIFEKGELKEFAEVYLHSLWASHVMGLTGFFFLDMSPLGREGAILEFAIPQFQKYMKLYLEAQIEKEEESRQLSEGRARQILAAVDRAHSPNRSLEEIQLSIAAGNSEIIVSGWKGHSITYVFHNGIFMICNRGDQSGDNPGIQVYAYDREKINKEILSDLLRKSSTSVNLDHNHMLQTIVAELEASHVGVIPMLGQKAGNCTIANQKASYFALLFSTGPSLERIEELPQEEKLALLESEINIAREQHRKTYKDFTTNLRKVVLRESIRFLNGNPIADQTLVRDLAQKGLNKGIINLPSSSEKRELVKEALL